jgi:hypothetical protein
MSVLGKLEGFYDAADPGFKHRRLGSVAQRASDGEVAAADGVGRRLRDFFCDFETDFE